MTDDGVDDLHASLPTLAISLIDQDPVKILVGVRSSFTNVNHPDVVSVPTMRLPIALGAAVLADVSAGKWPSSILTPGVAHEPVGYALWALLAAKLSLGDDIEAKAFDVAVEDAEILDGESLIGVDRGVNVTERLTMINLLCRVRTGGQLVPPSNPTFSILSWVPFTTFAEAAVTKRLEGLGTGFDAIETCIHGLCVRTAAGIYSRNFA